VNSRRGPSGDPAMPSERALLEFEPSHQAASSRLASETAQGFATTAQSGSSNTVFSGSALISNTRATALCPTNEPPPAGDHVVANGAPRRRPSPASRPSRSPQGGCRNGPQRLRRSPRGKAGFAAVVAPAERRPAWGGGRSWRRPTTSVLSIVPGRREAAARPRPAIRHNCTVRDEGQLGGRARETPGFNFKFSAQAQWACQRPKNPYPEIFEIFSRLIRTNWPEFWEMGLVAVHGRLKSERLPASAPGKRWPRAADRWRAQKRTRRAGRIPVDSWSRRRAVPLPGPESV
jgi:hypothetical protein